MDLYQLKQYIRPEYEYAIMRKNLDDAPDIVWCLETTLDAAIDRVNVEIDAYGNVEGYQFYYKAI